MPQSKRVYAVLIPTMLVTFLVSAVGRGQSPSDGAQYWVGAIAWFGFGAALLATVAFTVIVVVRMSLRRRTISAGNS